MVLSLFIFPNKVNLIFTPPLLTSSYLLYFLLTMGSLVGLCTFLFFIVRHKKNANQTNTVSEQVNLKTAVGKTALDSRAYLSVAKKEDILEALELFEKQHKYLRKDLSLNLLSAHLGINHRYLSYAINTYKEKDFTTYINELRINYIINCIESDKRYLNYKVSYLAEEAGFSSHSRFTITFKKVTDLCPSDYINKIKRRQLSQLNTADTIDKQAVNY